MEINLSSLTPTVCRDIKTGIKKNKYRKPKESNLYNAERQIQWNENEDKDYEAAIRPIMTYTAEMKPIALKTQEMLEVTEMRIIKKHVDHIGSSTKKWRINITRKQIGKKETKEVE